MGGNVVNIAERVTRLEAAMLEMPQAECPVVHRFAPGLYIREVSIPAGVFAIGHYQKTPHLCVMIRGCVSMVGPEGEVRTFTAPLTYVADPGRKVGYVHEAMTWLNVYATDETDVATLEARYLHKSEVWLAAQTADSVKLGFDHVDDHLDYAEALADLGTTADVVAKQSRDERDLVPFPLGEYRVRVAPSKIEGHGLFATAPIRVGEIIALARIGGMRTPAGRYANHADHENAEAVTLPNGDVALVALRDLSGARGGELGEEITVDYRQVARLNLSIASEVLP